ncbi:hypothetical protein F2Q69_00034636 [Brassica cretica]|uniref:Uncharacterized protein n=1 Tax=Brassica cretica TaxID=69181 RepID=A0A8S9SGI4_BRACR|nr:hypothetical protein F2Q69_00034636 [Brassica cretica]
MPFSSAPLRLMMLCMALLGTVQRSLAVFVILSDAGREFTGKYASELVSSYFEVT